MPAPPTGDPSTVADLGGEVSSIFGIDDDGAVSAAVQDRSWLRALLDVEAAVARAHGTAGSLPPAAAAAVAHLCAGTDLDPAAVGRAARASAGPVVPLVAALRAAAGPDLAPAVHLGATSQDILDTALMLVVRRALAPLVHDLARAATAAASLASEHRDTPQIGRTLLQQALPTTFGLVAAGWTATLDDAAGRLLRVDRQVLAVQWGGPVGARAPVASTSGDAVAAALAVELELVDPGVAWHSDRARIADIAACLGIAAGGLTKIARDVVLLAQSEVAEVAEGHAPGRGASSSMPHKQNPARSVAAIACGLRVPGLVATVFAGMAGEHQRAAGAWQAEWGTMTELLRLTGAAAAAVAQVLDGLQVDRVAMSGNLAAAAAATSIDPIPPHSCGELTDRLLAAHRVTGTATGEDTR